MTLSNSFLGQMETLSEPHQSDCLQGFGHKHQHFMSGSKGMKLRDVVTENYGCTSPTIDVTFFNLKSVDIFFLPKPVLSRIKSK